MSSFAPRDKLLLHPERLTAFNLGEDFAPVLVEISPTNLCNAKCPWCFYVSGEYKQRHSNESIGLSTLMAALEDMQYMGVEAVTWTGGGDPSVYAGIDQAIAWAHDRGLEQGMFTNGYKPIQQPELLKWVRLTVTEKFTVPKSASFYASKTRTGVNFNLTADNAKYLQAMVEQARDAGVHYFQVRPALADRADLQKPVVLPDWIHDYATDKFEIVATPYKFDDYMKPHGYPKCHGHQFVPFIWHNGDVAVCAYHFGREQFTFGNLNRESFRDIWWSYKSRRYKMIRDGVPVIADCQHCCKNHEINKGLAAIRGEYQLTRDGKFL